MSPPSAGCGVAGHVPEEPLHSPATFLPQSPPVPYNSPLRAPATRTLGADWQFSSHVRGEALAEVCLSALCKVRLPCLHVGYLHRGREGTLLLFLFSYF